MPPGHPPVGTTSRPAPKYETVTLKIHLLNGSAKDAPLANEAVTVALQHHGETLRKYEARSDDKGLVTIERVPALGLEPVVMLKHAGLDQQTDAYPPLDGTIPVVEFDTRPSIRRRRARILRSQCGTSSCGVCRITRACRSRK